MGISSDKVAIKEIMQARLPRAESMDAHEKRETRWARKKAGTAKAR
jgi:hypothetical protein